MDLYSVISYIVERSIYEKGAIPNGLAPFSMPKPIADYNSRQSTARV